jgi:hypothetical protein
MGGVQQSSPAYQHHRKLPPDPSLLLEGLLATLHAKLLVPPGLGTLLISPPL